MNRESSQQRHVSTFRMHIKPHRAPGSPGGNRQGTADARDRCINTHASVDLSTPRPLDAPVFMEPLQDCCVNEGGDVTLRGVLAGSQPIKVSWLHNGEVACFGRPSFDGREASFSVRECLPEDAGAYTCVAENGAGKTSCCAAVFVTDFETICGVQNPASSVQTSAFKSFAGNGRSPLQKFKGSVCTRPAGPDKPSPVSSPREVIPKKRANSESGLALHFKNPPQHFEVKVGQSARVTCFFAGRPPVASCWIRHKEQIVDGSDLWTESTDESTTLVIAEAKPEHTGRYAVVAKDRRSSVEHALTLSVIERPQPPASCPVVCVESAQRLVLSWSGPCYDGGSAVLGYVIEVKGQVPGAESGDWSELTAQCESTSYRVSSGLQPQREYSFRVRAYNAVGASEPGPESPVVTMEGKGVEKAEEGSAEYSCVAINASQKVTDHYSLQERLGMGKFGLVFKLAHKETGRINAGKFYKGRRATDREAARKEIELMNHLHHPKLVQCLAAYDHRPEMVMVMEFIAGGELFERIVDDNFVHTESASVSYMQQILEGIAFMHKQSIVHLDLKPENIVCVDTTGTSIKIIDFGLASRLDCNTPLKVMHGTPEFVAPEVINYEPVFLTTDMWSIGVICYILLSGESPFQGSNDAETLALVTAADWAFDEESFEEITDQAKHFISSLLLKDARRRMSSEEALAHPWMAYEPGDQATNRSLSKDRLKKFLARQKWKKAGKALLALKRMAMLSRSESSASGSPVSPRADSPLSPEAKPALQSLELKMQGPPRFTQSLVDQTVDRGSSARLSCHLTGYPDPEVVWLCGEEPVVETPSAQIEYEEDGCCTLVLAQVGPEDGNVYTCRATNDHGEASCSAELVVQR